MYKKETILMYITLYQKLDSKSIKDLNAKPNFLNCTGKKAGNSLDLISTGKTFLTRKPKAHAQD